MLRSWRPVLVAFLTAPLLLASGVVLAATPVKLWGETGVPVMTGPGDQIDAVATSDGAGGAIVAWTDDRRSTTVTDLYVDELYVQRLDAAGGRQWGPDALLIAPATFKSGQWFDVEAPAIASDGAGGAIVAWGDRRDFQTDVYAQRIAPNGTILWQANGVPVAKACPPVGGCGAHKTNIEIAADGAGGAIITWEEVRDGLTRSVWAQRVRGDGSVAWQTDGIPVAAGLELGAHVPKIAPDGAGGAFITWLEPSMVSGWTIRGQHVDATATALWAANGILVAEFTFGSADSHQIIPDGAGGLIVAWERRPQPTGNEVDIYAQRLNGAGASLWVAGGAPVCARAGRQDEPTLASDGAGGAIVAWKDVGLPSSPAVAQRLDATGAPRWASDGVPVSTGTAWVPDAVPDGSGGAYIGWGTVVQVGDEVRGPTLLLQHVDANGGLLWTEALELFHLATLHAIMSPRLVTDTAGGAVAYWPDYRFTGGTTRDIFANRVSDQVPPPAPTPADLSVTLSAAPPSAYVDEPVTLTATVTNAGPHAATLVALNTDVPVYYTRFSVTATQGTCAPEGISCNLGMLGPGASATVTFTIAVHSPSVLPAIGYVVGNEPDPDSVNNRAELEIPVAPRRPDPIFRDGFEGGGS
jgi:hypothetical protein